MTSEANVTPPAMGTVPQRGARADAVLRVMAMVTLFGVAVQFLLAGAGAFGEGFAMHVTLGRALGGWTLVVLVTVLVARAGREDVLNAVALFLIATVGQTGLAMLGQEATGWFGMFHVIGGVAVGGLASRIMANAKRRQQLREQAG